MKLFKRVFGLSDGITRLLQNRNIDAFTVSRKIDDYKDHLREMRSDSSFDELWTQVEGHDARIPRTRKVTAKLNTDTGYHQARSNEVGIEASMKALQYEVIDMLVEELDVRFADIERFQWMQLLHPDNFEVLHSNPLRLRQLIKSLKAIYPHLVPDEESFYSQLKILYNDSQLKEFTKDIQDLATLLNKMYSFELAEALPDVYKALVFCLSTGITSVACERSFSVLRRVKNYSRSTMSGERTKQLMFLSVESNVAKELSQHSEFIGRIIDRFAQMKPRRINLIYKL